MLTTAVVFTAGSLAAAFAATLPQLLLARFIAGLGHGLFLAAASSTAARLAGPGKAGRAVAVVFGGFYSGDGNRRTAEYMVGGGLMASSSRRYCRFWRVRIPWTVVRYERSRTQRAGEHGDSAMQNIGMLFNHQKLLAGALVTVLAYAGLVYGLHLYRTYSDAGDRVTGATVSLFMLVYGITAAVGNILGGNLPTAWG